MGRSGEGIGNYLRNLKKLSKKSFLDSFFIDGLALGSFTK